MVCCSGSAVFGSAAYSFFGHYLHWSDSLGLEHWRPLLLATYIILDLVRSEVDIGGLLAVLSKRSCCRFIGVELWSKLWNFALITLIIIF